MRRTSNAVSAFTDRRAAGVELATALTGFRGDPDAIVVGLPRGGVPVAAEVAGALDLPLDVIVVRKLGFPTRPEFAMGAIGDDDVVVVDRDLTKRLGVTDRTLASVERRERNELRRRVARFRRNRPARSLEGRTVIIVDDGIATGSTARAACQVARARGAQRIVVATPVAPHDWTTRLRDVADEFVALHTPHAFGAVGYFYRDFGQVSSDEVVEILDRANRATNRAASAASAASGRPATTRAARSEVTVTTQDGVELDGVLEVPGEFRGVVVFAHGSGSSRHSVRNRRVADALNDVGLATFLFDLLTESEASSRSNVFAVDVLATRVRSAVTTLRTGHDLDAAPFGLFGASTGAAAALVASVDDDLKISAVVSRGGRPDLAGPALDLVRAPTLLIVGGADRAVETLNREAERRMTCPTELAIVAGAGHLFEEPGALAEVARLAGEWFTEHFAGVSTHDERDSRP